MGDEARRPKTLKEMVEESPHWDAEELMRNLDAEMDRIEHGLAHMIWDDKNRPVTRCPALLPVTPKFKVKESEDKFRVEVALPKVPEDLINVKIDRTSIEVSACTPDCGCRPYYINIESKAPLDPESARLRHVEGTLEVEVDKLKKRRVSLK